MSFFAELILHKRNVIRLVGVQRMDSCKQHLTSPLRDQKKISFFFFFFLNQAVSRMSESFQFCNVSCTRLEVACSRPRLTFGLPVIFVSSSGDALPVFAIICSICPPASRQSHSNWTLSLQTESTSCKEMEHFHRLLCVCVCVMLLLNLCLDDELPSQWR